MTQRPLPYVRRAARVVAYGVAASGALALVASCRDVVTDDVVDAQAALCGTLKSCGVTKRACARVEAFFAGEDVDAFDSYLAFYQEWDCGEGCGTVGVCLDSEELCTPGGDKCKDAFDCCDASSGAASCGPNNVCCAALGVACVSPDECCPLGNDIQPGCFARVEGAPPTCGGLAECKRRDEECETDDDCCGTSSCNGGKCAPRVCVDRNGPCTGGDACCVPGDTCQGGTCGPREACAPADQPPCCAATNDLCTVGGLECCDGDCAATETGEFRCDRRCEDGDDEECHPCVTLGSTCDGDSDCCENGTDEIRCLGLDSTSTDQRICQPIECQLEPGGTCSVLPCCAGLSCLPDDVGDLTCQEKCSPGGCHPVREFGVPIDLASEGCNLAKGSDDAACVTEICEDPKSELYDPFCCCVAWDEECVGHGAECLLREGGSGGTAGSGENVGSSGAGAGGGMGSP